jgi:hypothetical protein
MLQEQLTSTGKKQTPDLTLYTKIEMGQLLGVKLLGKKCRTKESWPKNFRIDIKSMIHFL